MAQSSSTKPRKLAEPKYRSFRLQKRIKTSKPKLPSVKVLSLQSWTMFKQNKRFFIIFTVVYGLVMYFFIQSSAANIVDLSEAKKSLQGTFGGVLQTSLVLYAGLISTSAQIGSQLLAIYQFIIVLIFGLAIIYGLRFMYGDSPRKVTVKEALYKGMTPLVPVLLVLAVLTLQFLPLSLGSSLYASVTRQGLAITSVERLFWVVFVGLLLVLTIYMISATLFALFIVTLPDMTPMAALRASRELVRYRRLQVIRKILFLPLVMLIVLGILVVPFIAVIPSIAQIIFFIASALVLPVTITYLYNLYRSML